MHIYVATDNSGPTTWIVKSKDIKRFRREFDWIPCGRFLQEYFLVALADESRKLRLFVYRGRCIQNRN